MKRVMAAVLTIVMVALAVPVTFSFAEYTNYRVGDLIEYGSYPQSLVTDEALIAQLDATDSEWISYGYYSGTGDWFGGQMRSSDYMKYRDVTLAGKKYRAVRFTKYRPSKTTDEANINIDVSTVNSCQQYKNGYYINTTYWFRFDPISWRILDPFRGIILSEIVIDSQAYNNFSIYNFDDSRSLGAGFYGDKDFSHWESNYYFSSIRKWLNEDLYNTAFTSSQKTNIKTTHLENNSELAEYDAPDSDDKIFLLSFWDAINSSYGFSPNCSDYDTARRTQCSDYAKIQGLYSDTMWLLRTPHQDCFVYCVLEDGYSGGSDAGGCSFTINGVRPAMRVDLSKLTAKKSTAKITTQPKSVTQTTGTTAKFTVAATGSGTLSYQWKVSTDGKNWTNSKVTGYNTPTLQVPVKADKNGYKFCCVVTDANGSVTSSTATLTVTKSTANFTAQPKNLTQTVGTTAKFTVAATGSGTLSYQWKVSTDGKNWTNSKMTGYNTPTLQVPVKADKNGYKFCCVVTDANGSTTSNTATLTVIKSTAKITAQPQDITQEIGAGTTANFTVAATGSGTLSYQWKVSTDGTNWTNSKMTGYNTDTLQVPVKADKNGYKFRCVVKDANGSVTSGTATLTVIKSTAKITANPKSIIQITRTTAKFTVAATGSGTLNYQWKVSTDGTHWTNSKMTGYNTDTLQVPVKADKNGYMFMCVVTDANGTVTSSSATLTVV